MLFTPEGFVAFLRGLSLTQGLFKPEPSHSNTTKYGMHQVVGASNDTAGEIDLPVPSASVLPIVGSFQTKGKHGENAAANHYSVNSIDTTNSACQVAPYTAVVEDTILAPFDPARANIFRYRQQQSVNLGSW